MPEISATKGSSVSGKFLGLAGPAAIGIAVAVSACGTVSSTGAGAHSVSTVASSASPSGSGSVSPSGSVSSSGSAGPSAAAVPSGFRRVGGSPQGISIGVPSAWVAINLAKESIQTAAHSIGLTGISASTLIQDMESLQKLHAVFVFDLKSVADSASHFAANLNAYCSNSGITDYGSAGVPFVQQAAAIEFRQLHAADVKQRDIKVGGVPGLETTYQLTSASAGTLQAGQIEVLPKPDRACFVTLTSVKGQYPSRVLTVAAATAKFP